MPDLKCPFCGEDNAAGAEFCRKCRGRLLSREAAAAVALNGKLGSAGPFRDAPGSAPWRSRARALVALPLALITLRLFFASEPAFIFILDHVNLAFHEAGHVIFAFFGEFAHYLGGTLSQLLWPLVCWAHFRRRGEFFSADICLWWTGQSLLNISFYAADAVNQELPLVGGGVHDWAYLLAETGLTARTGTVGRAFAFAGLIVCAWAITRMLERERRRPTAG